MPSIDAVNASTVASLTTPASTLRREDEPPQARPQAEEAQSRAESGNVAFSASANVQSDAAAVQDAARRLAQVEPTQPVAVQNAVDRFAQTINRLDANPSPPRQDETLSPEARQQLESVGVSSSPEGTLQVDPNQLQQALANTPNEVVATLREVAQAAGEQAARSLPTAAAEPDATAAPSAPEEVSEPATAEANAPLAERANFSQQAASEYRKVSLF